MSAHCLSLFASLFVSLVLLVPVGRAATFVVDDYGAAGDAIPGDTVCETVGGVCTYAAAIDEANALFGPDRIELPAGTWVGFNFFEDDVELVGVGIAAGTGQATILDGGDATTPVVATTASVSLRDLVVQNGIQGVRMVSGDLQVEHCLFRDNYAGNVGGGISSDGGAVVVSASTFERNNAGNVGGAIHAHGAMDISDSTFEDNHAFNVAGAVNSEGPLTVTGSLFRRNTAGNVGGAISAEHGGTIQASTLIDNRCGNTSSAIDGRGGTLHLADLTIVSSKGRSTFGTGDSGTIKISNSIIWANGPCKLTGDNLVSEGFNIYPTTNCHFSSGAHPTDLLDVDPLLGYLLDNGGPTKTKGLLLGSPAIDASDSCGGTDQRGLPRPQGARCDIGAYERIACDFDGVVDANEQCDDGNHEDGDGCSALCQTELLSGRKLQLSAKPGDPGRAKLIFQSKDPSIAIGWGNKSGDDPVLYGGSVRLVSTAGEGLDMEFYLPAENWSYTGKRGANRGYKYTDLEGPIASIKIKPGRYIKVKGRGAALHQDLGSDPNPLHVFVTIGQRFFCASYGGTTKFAASRYYRASNAGAPSGSPGF